jgi:ferritin-like metal-binding protein YciE
MEGLIEEGAEVVEAEGPDPVIDAAIIAAARRAEHYEISAYEAALACARQLDKYDVVDLLQETLDEETAAEQKLSMIALEEVLPDARDMELAVLK